MQYLMHEILIWILFQIFQILFLFRGFGIVMCLVIFTGKKGIVVLDW